MPAGKRSSWAWPAAVPLADTVSIAVCSAVVSSVTPSPLAPNSVTERGGVAALETRTKIIPITATIATTTNICHDSIRLLRVDMNLRLLVVDFAKLYF